MIVNSALDVTDIFRRLSSNEPVRLDALPKSHGLYALYDHTHQVRYIGMTARDRGGFHGRICNRHVSGSESRSHKFSHAYNTGRMWRAKKDGSPGAVLAKSVRTKFIRTHCAATYVALPNQSEQDLGELELAVQALAPEPMLAWGGERGFMPVPEPMALVDDVIDALGLTAEQRAALDRQAELARKANRATASA